MTQNIIDQQQCSLKTEEWMTTGEAAAYLRISPAALRTMTCNGKIIFYKLLRRNRYKKSDLDKLLLSNKEGGQNGY